MVLCRGRMTVVKVSLPDPPQGAAFVAIDDADGLRVAPVQFDHCGMAWFKAMAVLGGLLVVAFFVLFMPPIYHDRAEPERTVTGVVSHLGWSEESQDLQMRLAGDSGHYYLNRALGMGIDGPEWKAAMLGDTVTLEVVHRPWGLARWTGAGPIRGVIFQGDTVYRTGRVRPLK